MLESTPKCHPAAHSRKGGAQRNLVRDPAQKCAAQRLFPALRQSGSALRAEYLRWIPDTLPLSLQGSGDVPRGGTFSFRERAACGMLELPNWPSCAGRPWRRGQSPAILPHCDGRGVDAVAGCVVANASDEVRAPGFAHAGDWSDALMRRRMERRR